jgi:hypothetical protein
VDTDLIQNFPADLRKALFEKAQNSSPVGHVGTPEEVAEAYIFAMKVSGGLLGCSVENSLT